MYEYLSFVMMLSESSSSAVSHATVICSISSALSPSEIDSITLGSLSKILIAYQRSSSSGTMPLMSALILAIVSSTVSAKFPSALTSLCSSAALIASSAASVCPSPLRALISITGQPMLLLSASTSIVSPFLRTRSIILTAITTGIPSSSSCVVKYRFLSIFVPSTMFKIASGLCVTRYSLVTTSSKVYGESEYIPGRS